jgi:hypothetical protein
MMPSQTFQQFVLCLWVVAGTADALTELVNQAETKLVPYIE